MVGGQLVLGDALRAVGLVDLDEREMRALAGVAAAATAAAEEHADVHVGAGGESGDRLGGELGPGGGGEGLAHAVRDRGADFDQPPGGIVAGEDA